ncbi:hypothetical protein BJY04DRAFT_215521 [Aspergillus karnatakaensis]|uniref:uncharacterized protein n=1 Tax=Aspergillus karnatakaensis TaxID=1810916 RepID=UPI003CCDFCD3
MSQSFTLINGQLHTPGLAIINAPQPYTPLGGDTLHISIDVSGNGQLSLSPDNDAPTRFHDLRIFLTSDALEMNLTVSNGTIPDSSSDDDEDDDNNDEGYPYVGPILDLEPSSTVKHVNWLWPGCFVGEGSGSSSSSSSSNDNEDGGDGDGNWRGSWNISIHQSFRLNDTEYYTVFDLPINVTNGIEEREGRGRVECGVLENGFDRAVVAGSNGSVGTPWAEGGSSDGGSGSDDGDEGEGEGGENGGVGLRAGGGLGLWLVLGLVVGMVL